MPSYVFAPYVPLQVTTLGLSHSWFPMDTWETAIPPGTWLKVVDVSRPQRPWAWALVTAVHHTGGVMDSAAHLILVAGSIYSMILSKKVKKVSVTKGR